MFRVNSIFFKINAIFFISLLIISVSTALIQFKTSEHTIRRAFKQYLKSGEHNLTFNHYGRDRRYFRIYRPEVIDGKLNIYSREFREFRATKVAVEINYLPLYIGGGLLSFITLLYYLIRRSLLPLKSLEKSIKRFREGDNSIKIEVVSNDEIGRVGLEFQKAVDHIEMLKRSRELFLRNIIHELKTPITKGKLFVALHENIDLKTLDRVFTRLDSLINELANIERLTSREVELSFLKIEALLVVEEALLLGFFDSIEIEEVEKVSVFADLKLLSIAFKNLIDNGIRYSEDGNIAVKIYSDRVEFVSKGEPLEKPLSEYIQPFSHSQITSNRGFGLGLYLVNEIAIRHKMELQYVNSEGSNSFFIVF